MLCVALTPLFSACTTSPSRPSPKAPNTENSVTSLVLFDQWMGDYVSIDPVGWRLNVERMPQPGTLSQRRFLLTQTHQDSSIAPRAFDLLVAQNDAGISSSFSPRSENGVDRACPLNWQWSGTGARLLFGRSSPDTCQFQADGQSLGLIKEMSFDGQTLRFADQLIDMNTGAPYLPLQITQFEKVERFQATVARQDGEQWRIAEATNLPSDGQRRAIVDAAGMPMDIALSIEPRMLHDQIHWVLVISEADTSDVIGQAWSRRGSTQTLGWASADTQVEVRRLP